jgi:DNA-directed RNA polymerase subunit omega
MIDELLSDKIIMKLGGRFRLTSLIQKRMMELNQGARPMVERAKGMTDMEVVIQEVLQDKITIDYDKSDIAKDVDKTRI